MNVQTRSVIKAALIGLAISFAVTAIGLLSKGQIDPIDPFWILNPRILGHWVGAIGFIPLIFVVVAIVVKFRHAALWLSALNFIGAFVGISFVISIVVVARSA